MCRFNDLTSPVGRESAVADVSTDHAAIAPACNQRSGEHTRLACWFRGSPKRTLVLFSRVSFCTFFPHIITRLRCMFEASMTEAEKRVREYLAKIGRRGGVASRRELTLAHAKKMVAIREAKRAALKAGKPWPPRDRKLLKLS